MTLSEAQENLVVLAAGRHIAASLQSLLKFRQIDLRIHEVSFEAFRHPSVNSLYRTQAVDFLREYNGKFKYAPEAFDYKGCSGKQVSDTVQAQVEHQITRNGWANRSRFIVIDPMLEPWAWGSSERIAQERRRSGC